LAHRGYLKQQGATDDPYGFANASATAYADYAARMPAMRVRTMTLTDAGQRARRGNRRPYANQVAKGLRI
jgi:hypothetical protein